jgi:hypothetical protein
MIGFIERWRLRRTLKKFVEREDLTLIERPPDRLKPLSNEFLEKKHFQFIVILLDGSEPEALSVAVDRICEIFEQHNAQPPDIAGGFLIHCLGAQDPELDSPELRLQIVDSLLARLGNKIRIVHGECIGHFGFYGSSLRFAYGAIIPRFSEIVDELVQLDDGTAAEIQPTRQ